MNDEHDMEHIGDGVYVSHDGYQLWFRVNSHMNPALVAMEPSVLYALDNYRRRIGLAPPKPTP